MKRTYLIGQTLKTSYNVVDRSKLCGILGGGVLSSTVAERAQIEIVGHGLGTADSLSSLPHFHL